MLNWLINLIPADYKWSVATKNIAYDVGKAAAGLLMWSKAAAIEKTLHITVTPAMQTQVANAVGVVTTAGLAWLHDYLQVKYPNAAWL